MYVLVLQVFPVSLVETVAPKVDRHLNHTMTEATSKTDRTVTTETETVTTETVTVTTETKTETIVIEIDLNEMNDPMVTDRNNRKKVCFLTLF